VFTVSVLVSMFFVDAVAIESEFENSRMLTEAARMKPSIGTSRSQLCLKTNYFFW